jgi:hypothetical protein
LPWIQISISQTVAIEIVIASGAKQSMEQQKNGSLRRFAPLRKRFAFVADNDIALADTPPRFHRLRASFDLIFDPLNIRGRRECRAIQYSTGRNG